MKFKIETPSGQTALFVYPHQTEKSHGAILFLHGFCENHHYFSLVAERLNRAGYDCIAMNFFGHEGSTPRKNAFELSDYRKQVIEILQEFQGTDRIVSPVAVWGHSMGATVLLLAADDLLSAQPEIKTLVLENVSVSENISLPGRMVASLSRFADSKLVRQALQPVVNLLFTGPIPHDEGKQFVKRMVRDFTPSRQVAVANVESLLDTSFNLDHLSGTTVRKLCFVFSKKDKMTCFRKTRKMILPKLQTHASFNRDQVLTLPADHLASLQMPEEVAEFVLGKLSPDALNARASTSAPA